MDTEQSKKKKIMVFAQTKQMDSQQIKPHRPDRSVKYIRMTHVDDMTSQSVNYETEKTVNSSSIVVTDNSSSYKKLLEIVSDHIAIQCLDTSQNSKMLPWVHMTISNAKR